MVSEPKAQPVKVPMNLSRKALAQYSIADKLPDNQLTLRLKCCRFTCTARDSFVLHFAELVYEIWGPLADDATKEQPPVRPVISALSALRQIDLTHTAYAIFPRRQSRSV